MFAWSADLSDDLRNKVSDFSMELTQCAAYYSMVSHCAENGGQAELAKTADAAYHNLTPLIFESGKIAGLNSAAAGPLARATTNGRERPRTSRATTTTWRLPVLFLG